LLSSSFEQSANREAGSLSIPAAKHPGFLNPGGNPQHHRVDIGGGIATQATSAACHTAWTLAARNGTATLGFKHAGADATSPRRLATIPGICARKNTKETLRSRCSELWIGAIES
jgi:hypothetical protein